VLAAGRGRNGGTIGGEVGTDKIIELWRAHTFRHGVLSACRRAHGQTADVAQSVGNGGCSVPIVSCADHRTERADQLEASTC
jgi:hypothetical protein